MIVAVDPTILRKAAVYAERLGKLEEEFDVRLEIGPHTGLRFSLADRPAAPFVLIRNPKSGTLALGLEAP